MFSRVSIRSLLGTVAGLAALAALVVQPASASVRNGELCSVQLYDGSIRASVYAYPTTTSGRATSVQLARAGAWCTNQVATAGWMSANKTYDSYEDQVEVCYIASSASPIAISVYADPSETREAEGDCLDIVGGDTHAPLWYP